MAYLNVKYTYAPHAKNDYFPSPTKILIVGETPSKLNYFITSLLYYLNKIHNILL